MHATEYFYLLSETDLVNWLNLRNLFWLKFCLDLTNVFRVKSHWMFVIFHFFQFNIFMPNPLKVNKYNRHRISRLAIEYFDLLYETDSVN